MTAITHIAAGENAVDVARTRFRAARRTSTAPEVLARHSRVALLAFQAFESRAEALQFLNSEKPALGGRPIDIAGASEEGVERVLAALASRT